MSVRHTASIILMVIILFAASSLVALAVTGAASFLATRQVTLIVDPAGSDGFKKVQWALDNATDGDTILVYPGTYREALVIDKEVNIKGGGSGKSFIVAGGVSVGLLVNHTNVKISGLNISNAYSGVQIIAGYATLSDCAVNGNVIGINMSMAYNCSLSSCVSVGNSGSGLALNNSPSNTFTGCRFDSNGQFGAYLYKSKGNSFLQGSCSYNLGFGLFLDEGSGSATIEGCTFDSNGYDGLTLVGSDMASIGNSTCNDNGVIGLFLSDSHDADIVAVTADNNDGAGIYLNGSSGNLFRECSSDMNSKYGVYLWLSDGNTFESGSASGNNGWGIYLYWLSNGNVIKGYNCSKNKETGIYLGDSDDGTVSDCVCSGNANSGIYLRTNGTAVSNCSLGGNGQYGFYLYYSDGVRISGCLIEKSGNTGIYSKFSRFNAVSSNVIRNNPIGLRFLMGSEKNTITGNVIISPWMGLPQAVDNGTNTWNGLDLGNYWSDHATYDTDLDGVCDLPYNINGSGGGADRYPSMVPLGYSQPIAVAGPDIFVKNGTTALLNGSRSYCAYGIANYTWGFEMDGRAVRLYGPQAAFKFQISGNHTVVLTVRDGGGNASSAEVVVHVSPIAKEPTEDEESKEHAIRPIVLQIFFLVMTVFGAFFITALKKRARN